MPACALRLKCVAYFSDVVQMPDDRPNSVSFASCERFVEIFHAHDLGDRPENFFATDAHLVGGLGEQRRLHVKAFVLALEQLAAEGEFRAFFFRDVDVAQILLELRLIDHRADVRALLSCASSIINVFNFSMTARDEFIVDALLHDDAARRRAALPGREERALHRAIHGCARDRVIDDRPADFCRPFPIALSLCASPPLRQVFAGGDRAGKADRVHFRLDRQSRCRPR